MPLRVTAPGDPSPRSGSKAARPETAVRSTSMGWARSIARTISITGSGTDRAARSSDPKSSSSARVGSSPRSSRYAVSSKVECPARSWIE